LKNKETATMTLRHIVMWSLKNPADAPRFKALLESCADVVPGIHQFEVGVRSGDLEANCDVVLVSLFDDQEALDAYQNHPRHKAIAVELGAMREHRHVVDYLPPS
jgi:quinol monooxygenase YgiN